MRHWIQKQARRPSIINEITEADEETLPYAEEDWDLPFSMQTRQIDGARPTKKYNP